jgi:hypothetical protein
MMNITDSPHYAAARRSQAFVSAALYEARNKSSSKRRRRTVPPAPPVPFDYTVFATSLYRKHLPLDLRLDLQQWFTMTSSHRGAFGCKDELWLDVAKAKAKARKGKDDDDDDDHIDTITGVVGCALCLLFCGANGSQSSLLEDMMVDEFFHTKWLRTPDGRHNLMSYCAVNDDRLSYICKYRMGGKSCGKLVHLAPPAQWLTTHPHAINHFVWREGQYGLKMLTGSWYRSHAFPFRGTKPRKGFYQCGLHGNMSEYGHPSGQWMVSRHAKQPAHGPGRRCPGRLCDLVRTENYFTWKTFIKYLLTDSRMSLYYKVVVLGSARLIQRQWRGYFARVCIVPFTMQTRASFNYSPTCVSWTSRITQEREWGQRWFNFLVSRRCNI